jgi:MYXO-CTERM domain-containing protein
MPRLALALAAILPTSVALATDPPRYAVQVIGGLEGAGSSGLVSFPLGLNNNGRAVGYAASTASQSEIINWKNGAVYSVGPVPGTNRSFGNRVNILGRIAGAAYITDASGAILQSRAVRWKGLSPQDLGTLGGLNAAALGINDSDRIVGYSTLPGESQVRAFQWYNGVISALPAPNGASQAYAYDISNNNHIVGVFGGPYPVRPVLWQNGFAYQLSMPAAARTGSASAVNDAGVVVGNYEINQYTGSYAAVAWYAGQRLDLGNLGGNLAYAIAADINNHNQIVGTSNSPTGNAGFVYHEGVMYDLQTRLMPGSTSMQIISAHAINDHGQIAAAAMVDGRITAVLLTPVSASTPSPGSLGVLGGFGLIAWRRRRR